MSVKCISDACSCGKENSRKSISLEVNFDILKGFDLASVVLISLLLSQCIIEKNSWACKEKQCAYSVKHISATEIAHNRGWSQREHKSTLSFWVEDQNECKMPVLRVRHFYFQPMIFYAVFLIHILWLLANLFLSIWFLYFCMKIRLRNLSLDHNLN